MRSGFTLIELIVTVTIIALISVVAILGFGQSQARARDARRIADVGSLGISIESFRTANGKYPDQYPTPGGAPITENLNVLVDAGLINVLPHDPKPISVYTGIRDDLFCDNYTYSNRMVPGNNLLTSFDYGPNGRAWAVYFRSEMASVNGHHPLDASVPASDNAACHSSPTSYTSYGAMVGAKL